MYDIAQKKKLSAPFAGPFRGERAPFPGSLSRAFPGPDATGRKKNLQNAKDILQKLLSRAPFPGLLQGPILPEGNENLQKAKDVLQKLLSRAPFPGPSFPGERRLGLGKALGKDPCGWGRKPFSGCQRPLEALPVLSRFPRGVWRPCAAFPGAFRGLSRAPNPCRDCSADR